MGWLETSNCQSEQRRLQMVFVVAIAIGPVWMSWIIILAIANMDIILKITCCVAMGIDQVVIAMGLSVLVTGVT